MTEEQDIFEKILNSVPNARRAKRGVLIDTDDGLFHLTGVVKNADYEGLGEDALFYAAFCSREDIEKIKHLSSAHDHLLKLRAEAIVDNPRLVRVFKKRKGTKKNWSLEGYYSNKQRERSYIRSLSKGNQSRLENIPAGSAYLNYANAICIKTKAGNIIAISEPLEYFLYFMNVFFYGDDFGIEDKDLFHSFLIAQRTMAGHESFDFDMDPRGKLPEHIEHFIRTITDLQYQFILGHEYSHHLLGHLNDSRLFTDNLSSLLYAHNGKEKIRHYKYSHKLEYDADWYAIKNIKGNSSYREMIANSAFLTLMFFETRKIISDYTNPGGGINYSSHPDPVDRIFKLRSKLNNRWGFSREQLENNIEYLTRYTNQFVNEHLVFNYDEFERYGSVYLPNFKPKLLMDRVDF